MEKSYYTAICPECGKEIEVDYYDYIDAKESGNPPFYCEDCNLLFNGEIIER